MKTVATPVLPDARHVRAGFPIGSPAAKPTDATEIIGRLAAARSALYALVCKMDAGQGVTQLDILEVHSDLGCLMYDMPEFHVAEEVA